MMNKVVSFGKKTFAHPVAVTGAYFALFLAGFAGVDFNRKLEMTEQDRNEFKMRVSEHLGESLEELHSKAYAGRMSFDNIKANRSRSVELYFLYVRAQQKKAEFKCDEEFSQKNSDDLEKMVADEYQGFAQRMCRRSMIRNGHVVKWFKAVIQDEFIKYFLAPVASFFAIRYFRNFDGKVVGK